MKLKLTVDDALKFSDQWSKGLTVHADSEGWRVACMVLAEEVRKLREESRQWDKTSLVEIMAERDALRRGEFICIKCGLRKDGEFKPGDL